MFASVGRCAQIAIASLAALSLAALSLVADGGEAASAQNVTAVTPALSTSRIATNSDFHSRRTFGTGFFDAKANKTVVTWNGPGMRFDVRAFHQGTQKWEPAVTVAPAFGAVDYNLYHDYGTMVHLPDGRYGIFAADHSHNLRLIKAPTANSVAGTWSNTKISSDYNLYPMPVVVGNSVYVFYSKYLQSTTGTYRTYRYIKSTYNKATLSWGAWSSPVTVIDSGETADRFNEVYAFGVHADATSGRIYLSWTMAGGMGGHYAQTRHLYVAYLNVSNGNMYTVGAASRGRTIDHAELASVKAFHSVPAATTDTDHDKTRPIQNSAISTAEDGSLRVAFGDRTSNTIKVARYVNGAWSAVTVDTNAYDFMDLGKSGKTLQVLYTKPSSANTLYLAESTDNGATWPTKRKAVVDFTRVAGYTAPDTIVYANFIENAAVSSIKAVGGTINWVQRKNHNTHWPIFAVR